MAKIDPGTQAVVALLDMEKAFDSVEWEYLFERFVRVGTPPYFVKAVELLYSGCSAQISVSRVWSELFRFRRGTRQGCPLSPLLFAVAIEALAGRLRRLHGHRGLAWAGRGI